jgi:hypothetical protein
VKAVADLGVEIHLQPSECEKKEASLRQLPSFHNLSVADTAKRRRGRFLDPGVR